MNIPLKVIYQLQNLFQHLQKNVEGTSDLA
jgi:hypothetical protein